MAEDVGQRLLCRLLSRAALLLHLYRSVHLQNLVGALLDDAQVLHHVALRHAAVAQHVTESSGAATNLLEYTLNARFEGGNGSGSSLGLLFVQRSAGFCFLQALLQVLKDLLALIVKRLPCALVLLDLGPELTDLLLKFFHLRIQLIDIVEQRKVLVFRLNKRGHQLVDVLDACRLLDLGERLFVRVNALERCFLILLMLGDFRVALNNLLAQPLLILSFKFSLELVKLLTLTHEFLDFLVLFDQIAELSPFFLKVLLLLISLGFQHCHLLLGTISCFKCYVGNLDDLGHFTLALFELALQFLVDAVKNHALPTKIINALAHGFVVCQRFVEFNERLVQAIL